MATETLFHVQDAPEGGFVARAMGYSICTEADSWVALRQAIRHDAACHCEGQDLPALIRLHAVREEVIPS